MSGVAEGRGRQALEPLDEGGLSPLPSVEQGAKAEPAQSRHRPGVESVRIGHALEPVDAVGAAAGDKLEAAHRLLVAGQQVRQDILDRPAVLRSRPEDFAFG
jgi:hypothetical protein